MNLFDCSVEQRTTEESVAVQCQGHITIADDLSYWNNILLRIKLFMVEIFIWWLKFTQEAANNGMRHIQKYVYSLV